MSRFTANSSDQSVVVQCPHNPQVSCDTCRLNNICLPLALENNDIEQLDEIIQRGRPLQKNQHLYRMGDAFQSVYAVRSGTIKAYRTTEDGREQITGFYFPGEVLGLDGISDNTHASSAKALETAAVCEVPFASLSRLSTLLPALQGHFFKLMSNEITQDQELITLLSKNAADERVAALLLSISSRNARRGLSPTKLWLPMSRIDIGNYLGLTVETVSRVFSRLQKLHILDVSNKEITILDIDAIRAMVHTTSSGTTVVKLNAG